MSNLTTFTNTQRLNVAFITSPRGTGDASVDFVMGVSGYLESLITGSSAGVLSLNSLGGILNIAGQGGVTVFTSGQTIFVSGSNEAIVNLSGYLTTGQADLRYYGINNPSGFITGFDSGLYLLKSETGQFQLTGNYVNSGDLNSYYPASNPSGYITGLVVSSVTTPYAEKVADYTLGENDGTVVATANNFTFTLPTAVGIQGRIYTIKNISNSTIAIATTSAQTIDGLASGLIKLSQYTTLQVQSTGGDWIIL